MLLQAPSRPDRSSPASAPPGALALLALASLIVGVDVYIVVVALPEIGGALGFSDQTLQLVISAYAITFGGFLLLGGRLGDLLGRRRMLALGLGLFGASSFAAGLAGSPAALLAARAVQGVGGALVYPATLALITALFTEGPERNRALSVWAAAGAGGLVLGSLLGGVLTDALGWESIFFVNVPFALLALLLAFSLIPPDAAHRRGRGFDLPGALTGTLGTSLLVLALVQGPESGWASSAVLASLAAGALLLIAFVRIERTARAPLLPLRLFRNRHLTIGAAITFLHLATFGSLLYFLTLYFQRVHGYSPLDTGLAFLLPTAFIVLGSSVGGRLVTRFGLRATLTAGLAIGSAGALATGLAFSPDRTYGDLIPGLVPLSVGDGLVYTTMFIAASSGVAAHEEGIASGIASTGTQIGAAVGLAVLVAIADVGGDAIGGEVQRAATSDGLRTGVLAAAAGIAATILVALNLRGAGEAATTAATPHSAGDSAPTRNAPQPPDRSAAGDPSIDLYPQKGSR